jgi:uncharacterized phage protein gp47/JayE
MPFARPTLQQLIERAASDIEARLPGTDARLRRSNLDVLSRVHSGAAHGLYGHLNFLSLQIIIDTAEEGYLDRWAGVWGVARLAAVKATGDVTVTGTNGVTVPAGTTLQRSDGAEYTTDADATIALGTATAVVTASVAGLDGNTAAASQLTFSSPIAGINGNALVAAGGLNQGADEETDDSLRARLLDRIQRPPHGGADFDYVKWAKEVAGVTRAWVYRQELGVGTVTVRFVRDDDAGGLIPDAGEVTAVQTYIDDRRPVTAQVTVVAPVAVPQNFTIALTPNSVAAKAAVTAELQDLLLREAEPGGTLLLSHIREAVSLATGESDNVVTVPNANVVRATGEISTMGVITWA